MIHRMDPAEDPTGEPMPERLVPMLAKPSKSLPPDDDRWAYEFKWDGVRAMAYVGARATALREPQPHRHHGLLPRAARARPGAGLAPRDPRRRDRRLRRGGAAELRAAAERHARHVRQRGAAAREARAGRVPRLRPALPRWPLADGPALQRAPRAPARARAAGPALADARRISSATGRRCWRRAAQAGSRASSPSGSTARTCRAGAPRWRKVKNIRRQEVVIGGWTAGEGGAATDRGAARRLPTTGGCATPATSAPASPTPSSIASPRCSSRAGSPFARAALPRDAALVEPPGSARWSSPSGRRTAAAASVVQGAAD